MINLLGLVLTMLLSEYIINFDLTTYVADTQILPSLQCVNIVCKVSYGNSTQSAGHNAQTQYSQS